MSTSISPIAPDQAQTEDAKPKRTRKTKPLYPIADGVKLEAAPDDYDPSKHRLVKAMFKDVPLYMEFRAGELEKQAVQLRADAAEYRINPPAAKTGAKKAKLVARLSKLEAKLAELGVNVDDLFGDEE